MAWAKYYENAVSHTDYCKSSYHPYMEKRRMRTVVYAYQNTCDIMVAYFAGLRTQKQDEAEKQTKPIK